jgi:RNA polymerase sigma-70 factor, ECF subfamily
VHAQPASYICPAVRAETLPPVEGFKSKLLKERVTMKSLEPKRRSNRNNYITLGQRDMELASAAQAGSVIAFVELYNFYAQRVFRLAMRITKNKEDAEDASQECFLRAFESLDSFRGHAAFGTWIGRIAINCSLMLLRKKRHRSEISLVQLSGSGEEVCVVEVRDKGPDPEKMLEQSERLAILDRAKQSLPSALRRPIELQYMKELSANEIAEILDITTPAVKARVFRARRRLRQRVMAY